jgi:hypothetical protein
MVMCLAADEEGAQAMKDDCETPEAALAAALACALEVPREQWISDVMFGQRSGTRRYWWSLRFTTEITSGTVSPRHEIPGQRAEHILHGWSKTYRAEPYANEEDGGGPR